jgi:Vitamin K-dependent gamma-carboxylase
VRVGFGLLLLNEAWLATQELRGAGFFGDRFHQPYVPEGLVPSAGIYTALLGLQWLAALLVLSGRWARPALLVSASLLVYAMLCDRLWFHHYRHTMAAFCTLLAFAPCDRHLVLGRDAQAGPGPLWAQHAIKAQVSFMYLASAGSKLLDPEWRGGQMWGRMMSGVATSLPASIAHAVETPLGASLMAKGAITTELALAVLLWVPRTRRYAIALGVLFHLAISMLTPVRLFTIEMLLVYLLFLAPDLDPRPVRRGSPRRAP